MPRKRGGAKCTVTIDGIEETQNGAQQPQQTPPPSKNTFNLIPQNYSIPLNAKNKLDTSKFNSEYRDIVQNNYKSIGNSYLQYIDNITTALSEYRKSILDSTQQKTANELIRVVEETRTAISQPLKQGGKKNKRQYRKKRGGEEMQPMIPMPSIIPSLPMSQEGGKKKRQYKKKRGGEEMQPMIPMPSIIPSLPMSQEGGKKKRQYKKKGGGEDPVPPPESPVPPEMQDGGKKKKKRQYKKKRGGNIEQDVSGLSNKVQGLLSKIY